MESQDLKSGGTFGGKRHKDGGTPIRVGGNVVAEAEVGEIIINRKSSELFCEQLSKINQAGGGVNIDCDKTRDAISDTEYRNGGKIIALSGELKNKDGLLLRYKKEGKLFLFNVYEPKKIDVKEYSQIKYTCRTKDCPLEMSYNEFIKYLYSQEYIDDKEHYKLGGNVIAEVNTGGAIKGGLSEGMTIIDIAKMHNADIDYAQKQLDKGTLVEMEHTDRKEIAKEIAKDHLFEDIEYYNKLATLKLEKGGTCGCTHKMSEGGNVNSLYYYLPECECILEPRGNAGLEGYVVGVRYKYEYREADKRGKPYYRVFINSDYYETCGVTVFKRYFKKVK